MIWCSNGSHIQHTIETEAMCHNGIPSVFSFFSHFTGPLAKMFSDGWLRWLWS